MVFKRSSLRYAHTIGHTETIYSRDGAYIFTCGSDGDVRKWNGIEDDDPSSNCLGEFVVCIAHTPDNRLLAATCRNTVQAYTIPEMDKDGTLMRFTAMATCLYVSDAYIAAGSEDTNVKVIRKGESQPAYDLQGHSGPVLGIDICKHKHLLASIAGDGCLKIWDLRADGKEVKSISGMIRANSFELTDCFGTPRFEPSKGNSLVYVKDKEIVVLSTTTWETQFALTDERIKGNYACCAFSADGQLVAAGTTTGEISVFDFLRKTSYKCEPRAGGEEAISSIAWNPKNKLELCYCDASGQLGTLYSSEGALVSNGKHEVASSAVSLLDDEAGEVDFDGIEFEKDDADGDDDADDAANDIYAEHHNDYDDKDDNDDDGVSIERLKNKIMRKAENIEIDDDNTRDSAKTSKSFAPSTAHHYQPQIKLFKQQTAFQPTATPTHLEHRYLAWNSVGIVTAHADGVDGAIDVDFHDTSVHHALHIPNHNNHNMASLSETALALSAEGASKLVCIALAASGNKEWSVQIPDLECVEALAVTNKLVAVATNLHFLRLFTVMGIQREIISLPGPVVAMAGFGERLIVCYHTSAPSERQQHLGAMLIQTIGITLRTQIIVFSIPPERTLSWLGFSDCGSPVLADSMGMVQLFSLKSHCWFPICDTIKHSQSISNNYFVIAVLERSQIVQAVLCRGASYPMTNPRPMMQELPMHLSLCDADNEKSELEDALLRAVLMQGNGADKTMKETAIKLFALSCRSELELRAKELIETIACPDLLLLAVKYASKLGRIHLSDRLYELSPNLEQRIEQGKEEWQEIQAHQHIPNISLLTTSHTNNTSSLKLAPKAMEINSAKRASLKRFSLASKTRDTDSRSNTPNLMFNTESLLDGEEHTENFITSTKVDTQDLKEATRSPLNPVNPFASKRKLGETEFGGKREIIMGSEKLKLARK